LLLLRTLPLAASASGAPYYFSLRERQGDLRLPLLPSEEVQYFPGGDPEAEFYRRFQAPFAGFSARYRDAQALEEKGDYAGALRLYKKLDHDGLGDQRLLEPLIPADQLKLTEAGRAEDLEEENEEAPAAKPWPRERLKKALSGSKAELEELNGVMPLKLMRRQMDEVADRLETLNEARLQDKEGCRLYLALREAYAGSQAQDLTRLAQSLSARELWKGPAEYLELAHEPQPAKERLRQHLKKFPAARATWVFAFKGLNREETYGYLKYLMKHYPRSRYADDACLMLLRMDIENGDLKAGGAHYRQLVMEYPASDTALQGRLHPVLAAMTELYASEDLRQAYWVLAGGRGKFDPLSSPLDGVDPLTNRYLMRLDPAYRKRLLDTHVPGYELERLREDDEAFKEKERNYQADPEQRDALIEDYLRLDPANPRLGRLLEAAYSRNAGLSQLSRLAGQVERASRHLDISWILRSRDRWDRKEPLPFKDASLREAQAVLRKDDRALVRDFPQSPWALPAYMRLCHRDGELELLKKFEAGFAASPKAPQRWKDAARLKLALALYREGQWGDALALATDLAHPGWELYDEALWLRSASQERLSRTAEALAGYAQLRAAFPLLGQPYSTEQFYQWGQTYAQLERGPQSSPYGGLALAKLAAEDERQGRWKESMQSYQSLGYQWDLALMKDFAMPTGAWLEWLKLHPEENDDVARGTTAIRYLRENRIDEALAAMQGTALAETTVRTRRSRRNRESKEKQRLQWAQELKALQQVLDGARGPEARQRARYAMGRFYFNAPGLYDNPGLWQGLFYRSTPRPESLPMDPSWHIPYNSKGDAEYQFRRAWQEMPGGPLQPEAMYSQGLALAYGALPYRGEERDTAGLFLRTAESNPKSSLADDGLFWSGHFSSVSKQASVAESLAKDYPMGDIVRFLGLKNLAEAMERGQRLGWESKDYGLLSHNALIRRSSGLPGKAGAGLEFVEAHFPQTMDRGQVVEGWLYYRNASSQALKGSVVLKLEDALGGGLKAGFEGESQTALAGNELVLEGGSWQPQMTRWIWVRMIPQSRVFVLHQHLAGQADQSLSFQAQEGLKRVSRDMELPKGALGCGSRLGRDAQGRIWRFFQDGDSIHLGAYDQGAKLDWQISPQWPEGRALLDRYAGKLHWSLQSVLQSHFRILSDGSLLWLRYDIGASLKKGDTLGLRFVQGKENPQKLVSSKDFTIANLSSWPRKLLELSDPSLLALYSDSSWGRPSKETQADPEGRKLELDPYDRFPSPAMKIVDAKGKVLYSNRLLPDKEEGFPYSDGDCAWSTAGRRWACQGAIGKTLKVIELSWEAP
jgi:TolA-binding protein